ncbi:hypothetical protein [Curtobacterium sp. MCSS17_016]|uniref:hypothetical protein n=1 Tax=Curtobacterium sp. MCSS17_016 TaxID=2175644 RepID=UPI000DA9771B|nr:hypothetical protein [Curtobacterium sp. MCSS17_016]WIE81032.1 hypothetical protein DEJ19_021180 [Curtobacterium sp. MCSS17_016]
MERNPATYRKAAEKVHALSAAAGNPTLKRDGDTLRQVHPDGSTTKVADMPKDIAALLAATGGNTFLLAYLEAQFTHTADQLDYWGNRIGRDTVDPEGVVLRLAESFLPAKRTTKQVAA